jgi:DNA-binding transcriptional LysR family regulator
MLLELRDAEGLVSQMLKAPTGTLRVELPPALGRLYIMPVLSNFAAQYPDFSVQAVFREQHADLADDNVDVSIWLGPVSSSRHTFQKGGSTRYITCASPQYLKQYGTPRRPEHLLQHNCLGYVSPRTGRQREWHFASGRTPFSLAVSGNLSMSNTDGLVQAAVNGHGIVQVLDFVALNVLNTGLLKPLLLDWIAKEQPIMITYPTKQGGSPKVRAFTQFVFQYLPRPIAIDAMRAMAS